MTADAALRRALLRHSGFEADPALTPRGCKSRYENLGIVLSDNTVAQVRVHKYRINEPDPAQIGPNRIRHADATTEFGRAWSHLRRWRQQQSPIPEDLREAVVRRVLGLPLRTTFNGKGSPRDISMCLTALSVSGRIDAALPNFIGTERGRISGYVSQFIGIDCSGFVNNYFIASGQYTDSAANRNVTIRHQYGRQNNRLHFLPDNPQGFMLVWLDFGHIAMIHEWGPGGYEVDLRVVESGASLGGLSETIYDVRGPPDMEGDPVWTLFSRGRGRESEVYMVSPLGPRQ